MKPLPLIIGLAAILPLCTFAQEPMERPGKDAFFETVLESVDESTAESLEASKDELREQREALRALRDSGADEETIRAAAQDLRADGRAFREEVRAIIDADEDLQAALDEARANGDLPRRPHRGGMRPRRGEAE